MWPAADGSWRVISGGASRALQSNLARTFEVTPFPGTRVAWCVASRSAPARPLTWPPIARARLLFPQEEFYAPWAALLFHRSHYHPHRQPHSPYRPPTVPPTSRCAGVHGIATASAPQSAVRSDAQTQIIAARAPDQVARASNTTHDPRPGTPRNFSRYNTRATSSSEPNAKRRTHPTTRRLPWSRVDHPSASYVRMPMSSSRTGRGWMGFLLVLSRP